MFKFIIIFKITVRYVWTVNILLKSWLTLKFEVQSANVVVVVVVVVVGFIVVVVVTVVSSFETVVYGAVVYVIVRGLKGLVEFAANFPQWPSLTHITVTGTTTATTKINDMAAQSLKKQCKTI